MSEAPKKTYRIGTLRTGKAKDIDGETRPSVYLALGDLKNTDPKYNTSVEVIVRDHLGNVVYQQQNGFINLDDPRTGKFPKPNTPAFIRYELKVSPR